MESMESAKAKVDSKKYIGDCLKEAGIKTPYKSLLFEIYLPYVFGIMQRGNGSHATALKGFVQGLEAAMERDKAGKEEHAGYNTLEMQMCSRTAVEYPEKLAELTAMMEENSITNSSALIIAEKLGIEGCLPEYLKSRLEKKIKLPPGPKK